MKNGKKNITSASTWHRRIVFAIVIFLNIALLSWAFLIYGRYVSIYQERLWQENLGNIANINRSSGMNATALISSWNTKLADLVQYITLHDMTRDEALAMIDEANSNSNRFFELIGSDYTGFVARRNADGSYPSLSYANNSYKSLQKAFDDVDDDDYNGICFAPEFTDGDTALKFFAIYKHLPLYNGDGQQEIYTLLLASRSADVLAAFNNQLSYEGQSSVLIDAQGNYIVSNSDFKSSNFFQYLYGYNDLTLDEKNNIFSKMSETGKGELFYKNASKTVEDCVYRYERVGSNNWYCVTCIPISSFRTSVYNSNYIIAVVAILVSMLIVDVTWLQSTNRRLRVSMARETAANAAKGNFMSRMSHEIRTPLNAVIGYTTIARSEMSEAKSDAERRKAEMKVLDCLMKSDIASKHLLTIINDVLDMSAIESGRIKVAHERFDFKGLITSLTTVFYSQAKTKGVNFEVVFDNLTEEWFIGDQMRVNQILTNLLSNAIKFTPEGGCVKLLIHQPEADTNASHIHFDVSDTGIGMTEEYLSHIWTPFEQADSSISRRFGGTGLGLAITKNLVDIMKGNITVESHQGIGTTFGVDLYFERAEQPETVDPYDFSSVNALIVDDDQSTCDYVVQLFNRCGARCASATSGEAAVEAFQAAEKQDDHFTVCLVDWNMPKMNGIETIKQIRELTGSRIPMIVITAYDYSEISEQAESAGIDMFISKPLFQSSLFDLLAGISGVRAPNKSASGKEYSFAGSRVLLAEDNAMNIEIAQRLLEMADIDVESAENGAEAIEMFEQHSKGYYDAILMDVHMPVVDGHAATRTIRASQHPQAKTIPIIAMTADAFAENVAEAIEAGMNDHISKPIDVHTLFETLSKYIAKRKDL